jgi:hypothetical protein
LSYPAGSVGADVMSRFGVTPMSAEPAYTNDHTTTPSAAAGAADEAWRTPRSDEILALPGVQQILDSEVLWLRSGEELARAFNSIEAAISDTIGNSQPNEWDSLDEDERARLGVYQAARWTLQQIPTSPMGSGLIPVTGGSLCRELDCAVIRMRSRGHGWEYAMGVAIWLMWITGYNDLVLPGDERSAPHR